MSPKPSRPARTTAVRGPAPMPPVAVPEVLVWGLDRPIAEDPTPERVVAELRAGREALFESMAREHLVPVGKTRITLVINDEGLPTWRYTARVSRFI